MRPEVLAAAPASIRDVWSGLPCTHHSLRFKTYVGNPTGWLLPVPLCVMHGLDCTHGASVWNVNHSNPKDRLLPMRPWGCMVWATLQPS